jgi:hypothetical protein
MQKVPNKYKECPCPRPPSLPKMGDTKLSSHQHGYETNLAKWNHWVDSMGSINAFMKLY